jgi:hypothetical protein
LLVERVAGQGEYQATATSFEPGLPPPDARSPQNSKQQRCVKAQGKLGRKAAAGEVRNARACVQDAARGKTDKLGSTSQTRTAQACLTNDVRNRVAKVAQTAARKDEKVCSEEPPDFGYAGADALVSAPVEAIEALIADLFGVDLDAALVSESVDAAGAACQYEVVRRVGAVHDAAVRTALAESKSALAGEVGTADELALAIGSGLFGDSRGKIGKARSKLLSRTRKRCEGAALTALFPGSCAPVTEVDAFAQCAAERTLCRQCLAEELARSIDLDCDQLDDASANASCGGSPCGRSLLWWNPAGERAYRASVPASEGRRHHEDDPLAARGSGRPVCGQPQCDSEIWLGQQLLRERDLVETAYFDGITRDAHQ